MKEYFNGFSTQDLVDMKRNDEKRKEKVKMEKEIEILHSIIKEVREELNKIDSATYQGDTDKKTYYKYEQTRIQKLLEILGGENNDK